MREWQEVTIKSEQVFVKLFSKSLWDAGQSPATKYLTYES